MSLVLQVLFLTFLYGSNRHSIGSAHKLEYYDFYEKMQNSSLYKNYNP